MTHLVDLLRIICFLYLILMLSEEVMFTRLFFLIISVSCEVACLWYIKGDTCIYFFASLLSFTLFLACIIHTIYVWVWTICFKSISRVLGSRTTNEIGSSHITSKISKRIWKLQILRFWMSDLNHTIPWFE